MEFGLYTFADMIPDNTAGHAKNANQRIKDLLEEIALADQAGLDVFGVGEHHRPDYAASSPATILAAAAAITSNIKLTSAVTVLSSDDPVRVYQQFATVDQLSDGRAEIMVGRGSFIESFPLFGYDLEQYDELFEEKLDLLLKINKHEIVTSDTKLRAAIPSRGVYPRPIQDKLPIWVAVGGTPASAVRAAKLGLPLALAIIGGMPAQFAPFIKLYRDRFEQAGHDPRAAQVGINSHVYIGETSQKAADDFFPSYAAMMQRIGRERGWSPMTRDQYEYMRSPKGSLLVGSPEEITDKILYEHELFGNTRFLAQMSLGDMPHNKILRSIDLFATKVVPAVKKALQSSTNEVELSKQ